MLNSRQRVLAAAAAGLVAIWLVAWAGHRHFTSLQVTPEKVRAYIASVDLPRLTPAQRTKALQALADQLNALSFEDRQRLRVERTAYDWFTEMSEEEKARFIEATMPTGFKQMIAAFEEQPEEQRRRAINDALRRLRETSAESRRTEGREEDGPPLSPELEARVRTLGLKTFYAESSAQTKAELAPVLEELQRAMESGRAFRRR